MKFSSSPSLWNTQCCSTVKTAALGGALGCSWQIQMGSNQPVGEEFQLSQSGYVIFYELDSLFPHETREKQGSRETTSAPAERCLSKAGAISHFMHHRHAGKRLKSHPETSGRARPGQGRASGEQRGRAGAVPPAGPARPPAPHSHGEPSSGGRGAAGRGHRH